MGNYGVVGQPDFNRDGKADVLLQSVSVPPRAKNPYGFVGKAGYYSDEESGLQLLGHRYYLPKLGRFLTQDPIGHDAGLNLYEYVHNNPANGSDPTGKQGVMATIQELFTLDAWGEGLKTSGGVAGGVLTFGLWDNSWYRDRPGYEGSNVAARIARDTGLQIAGVGAFRFLSGAGMPLEGLAAWFARGSEMDDAWATLSLKDKVFYEVGQKTLNLSEAAFDAAYGGLTTVERGRKIYSEVGWFKAAFPESAKFMQSGSGGTLSSGPTAVFRFSMKWMYAGAPTMFEVGGR